VETLSHEVLEELRHARAPRERKIAVCTTGAHIPPVDRVEILSVLASDGDEMIATRAQEALLTFTPDIFVQALKRENPLPALFGYASKNLGKHPEVVEAMVANRNCAGAFLIPLVPRLTRAQVQLLVEELDRISASPGLVTALEHSSILTADQKNVLHELRGTTPAPSNDKVFAEAAAEAEPDANRRQTLLQQIAQMTVAQRVQFAIKGGSDARRTLIRDGSKVVQRAVLQSPRLTDQEVESFAAMSSLTDEILRLIAGNRAFRKNYVVVRNLMNNAKTPLDVTLHMLPLLNPADLKKLSLNKNVPDTLRTSAAKLLRTRNEQKK
jgi:hypothetical protein